MSRPDGSMRPASTIKAARARGRKERREKREEEAQRPEDPTEEDLMPQPGPQEQFCACEADIAIYGGAAGGGKSFALLLEASRNVHVPGYAAVIFRRTGPELAGAGSIWEESQGVYPLIGGQSLQGPTLHWWFRTADPEREALIEFRHIQYEKDVHSYQGKQYAFIGFDELTSFTEKQFWYMVSRNRSTCGVRPYMRGTCNPDPDSFVRKLIDWWIGEDGFPIEERSGALRYFVRKGHELFWAGTAEELRARHGVEPTSFTFIAARLEDNQKLEQKDPSYRAKLESLPHVDRMQLLKGNWDIRPSSGLYFKKHWFEVVETPPAKVVVRVRAWDKAATKPSPGNMDPDWTVGVRVSLDEQGVVYIEHAERLQESPANVEKAVVNTAKLDGRKTVVAMWQDPAQAGKSEVAHFARLLLGYTYFTQQANQEKLTWAKPVSSQAEAGNIRIVRGAWNDAYLKVMEDFPPAEGKGHDDDVDATSLAFVYLAKRYVDRLRRLVQWGKSREQGGAQDEPLAAMKQASKDQLVAKLKRKFPNLAVGG